MKNIFKGFLASSTAISLLASMLCGQKVKGKPTIQSKARPAIFAVINDGTGIEPIAYVENGKLVAVGDTATDQSDLAKTYYKTGAKYDLIFGGVSNGAVTVARSNVGTDCGGSSAEVSVNSPKVKLKGFVMGLTTNIPAKAKASGLRRMPSAAERSAIEALVRGEYAKHKVAPAAYKQLHYQNLTAVDVDNDGTAELIGSYWCTPKTDERDLLFFIAAKDDSGKYSFNYSDYQVITPDKVMSGELKDVEDGIYQTLLLDIFDYDGDGTAEIFAIGKAFEGNNYSAFKRSSGKWTKVLDAYDYRCGY